ncbi:MAG: hypothetical protein NG737_01470 [Omnitrophica bacterium]|nr:hypothetical protein [Candidatus Omnitrophota bacterium]
MRTVLNKVFRRIVDLVRYSNRDIQQDKKNVFIDIDAKILVRRIKELFIIFELSGYAVFFRARFNRLTISVAGILASYRNVSLTWREPTRHKYSILCTNKNLKSWHNRVNIQKNIHLTFDYSPKLKLDSTNFALPFLMHTQIYTQYHDDKKLSFYRKLTKIIKILFAGNWSKVYHNATICNICSMLSRYEIIKYIISENLAKIVHSEEEFDLLLSGEYSNLFVLIDTSSMRINQQRWLEVISYAEFLLSPPGVTMPLSANAIEAMAVGTIPIINYSQWFLPPFKHNVNCLTFNSLVGLKETIKQALEMGGQRITNLRNKVIEHYDDKLNLNKSLQRIVSCPDKHVHLHMWSENPDYIRKAMGYQQD